MKSQFPFNLKNSTILMEKINDTSSQMSKQQTGGKGRENVPHLPAAVLPLEVTAIPEKYQEKHSNFSIEYILNIDEKKESQLDCGKVHYDWLNYTRYRPPKLQRNRKKECTKQRRLGRNPRIPFSSSQVTILEEKFQINAYLSNADIVDLSKCLQLSESRIKIWFQNRRARERRDIHDSSKKGINLIKSFLMETRSTDEAAGVQGLLESAFKPCQNCSK